MGHLDAPAERQRDDLTLAGAFGSAAALASAGSAWLAPRW